MVVSLIRFNARVNIVTYNIYNKIIKTNLLIVLFLNAGCTSDIPLRSTLDCNQLLINKYISYRADLFNNRDPSSFFNEDFFIKQMKSLYLSKKESSDRINKYMESRNTIQRKVKQLSGFYAECSSDGTAKLLIETKLFGDNKDLFYFVIMFVDDKAVNITRDYLPSAESYFHNFQLKPINYSFEEKYRSNLSGSQLISSGLYGR